MSVYTPTLSDQRLRTRGRWCAAAGLLGLIQGLALLVWPAQVDEDRFSFPLTGAGHVVAQATFFLQHLPLVLAVTAILGVVTSRSVRYGLVAAAIGLGLLAAMELVTMTGATTTTDSALASALYAAYGPPVLLAGVGLSVAGVGLVRRRELDTRISWLVLGLGLWVFVGLTPALSTGSFVAGRLSIMAWMVLFTGLGWAMAAPQRPGSAEPSTRPSRA